MPSKPKPKHTAAAAVTTRARARRIREDNSAAFAFAVEVPERFMVGPRVHRASVPTDAKDYAAVVAFFRGAARREFERLLLTNLRPTPGEDALGRQCRYARLVSVVQNGELWFSKAITPYMKARYASLRELTQGMQADRAIAEISIELRHVVLDAAALGVLQRALVAERSPSGILAVTPEQAQEHFAKIVQQLCAAVARPLVYMARGHVPPAPLRFWAVQLTSAVFPGCLETWLHLVLRAVFDRLTADGPARVRYGPEPDNVYEIPPARMYTRGTPEAPRGLSHFRVQNKRDMVLRIGTTGYSIYAHMRSDSMALAELSVRADPHTLGPLCRRMAAARTAEMHSYSGMSYAGCLDAIDTHICDENWANVAVSESDVI